MRGLTPKQAKFVGEYLIDLNATQAAIRAGYSAKTADRIGAQLLGKTWVASAVAERMTARERRTEVTQDRVLLELARLAFFDPRRLLNDDGTPKQVTELDDDTAAAIAGMKVRTVASADGTTATVTEYKIADKGQAITNAMRHLGMFSDRLDVNLVGPLAERLARARARNG
ncbi:terminase small subunit [Pseudothauera rhizosphaerae]|uniref:Terminase small subunit n=1 Tax=Pseudothauera rhizosphaerae TaxID=2565932 RepID=A0A4S4AXG9_9RHOO|nr:terminase small subunit [Pseudothauera rhizosphaerae]THF64333.1 terminase small subunit [Pseudothauera rhizosphaerae]